MELVNLFTANTSARTYPEKSPTAASVAMQVTKRSYAEVTENLQEIDNNSGSQNSNIDTLSLVSPTNQKPNQTPRSLPKATLHPGNSEESRT